MPHSPPGFGFKHFYPVMHRDRFFHPESLPQEEPMNHQDPFVLQDFNVAPGEKQRAVLTVAD